MKDMRSRLILLVVLLSPGCYSYRVTELQDVAPGTPVRLRVTPDEAERLVEFRLTDDRLVDGVLVENGGMGLVLDTRVGVNDAQRGSRAFTQRINIPASEVREVELKQLDWFKTGVAIGATAIGLAIVASAAFGDGEGRDGPPGPDPSDLRVPTGFSLRLPFALPFVSR
jgi:hypothetical protein